MRQRNYVDEALSLHSQQEAAQRARAERESLERHRRLEAFHEHAHQVIGAHLTRALAAAFGAQVDDREFRDLRWWGSDLWSRPSVDEDPDGRLSVRQRPATTWCSPGWYHADFQGVVVHARAELPDGWRPDYHDAALPPAVLAVRVDGKPIEFRDLATFGAAVRRHREHTQHLRTQEALAAQARRRTWWTRLIQGDRA